MFDKSNQTHQNTIQAAQGLDGVLLHLQYDIYNPPIPVASFEQAITGFRPEDSDLRIVFNF
jgi:hypothetical protein